MPLAMPVLPGFFDGKQPCIRMQVSGTQGSPEEISAVIDTGFNGFLMMSARQADIHQFEAGPSTAATLADGSRIALQTALARIGFAGRTHQGVVTLAPAHVSINLVGIDFLRRFNLALVMTHEQVWLMDEPDFVRIALQSGARISDTGQSG
ncbi:MAG: hypothetical protein KF686_17940 [Ramlibacter sp.]|nr:hypothetical protein [Ramlibacter sp.]